MILRLRQGGDDVTYLVAGDLHLGFESELARRGAFLKSRSRQLADHLVDLAKAHRATRLVLLGDVKHRVTHHTRQERRDVPAFFERLSLFEEVHVALGNHDGGLRSLAPTRRFLNLAYHPPSGFVLRGEDTSIGFLHGHAWPRPGLLRADAILAGHTHAAVALVDEQGRATTEWGWVRCRLDAAAVRAKYGRAAAPQLVVFPPFNPLCGGTAVNRQGLLGPLRKLMDAAKSELFLLDGRRLGSLEV